MSYVAKHSRYRCGVCEVMEKREQGDEKMFLNGAADFAEIQMGEWRCVVCCDCGAVQIAVEHIEELQKLAEEKRQQALRGGE